MIKATSANMVIRNSGNYLVNLLAAEAVAGIIILFSYHCAGKIRHYTPMDAIRSGDTGERYGKKGKIHLSKSKTPLPVCLALNDVLSNPRRYAVLLLAFTLSLILVVMLSNTANTLNSPSLVKMLGMKESDFYLDASVLEVEKVMAPGGKVYLQDQLEQIEMNDAGIPCRVHTEAWVSATIEKGENIIRTMGYYGMGSNPEEYEYLEGSAPQNPDEIALTAVNAERLGVSVGDTLRCNGRECLVTATFDCFNNLGDSMRFYPEEGTEFGHCQGMSDVQITLLQETDQAERACICRSLVNHPKMIFANEPTGALNRTVSQEVMEQLQKVNKDGTTVLMVTHDVRVAARCSRVLYIQDGGIASEKALGRLEKEQELRSRGQALSNWLMELGW